MTDTPATPKPLSTLTPEDQHAKVVAEIAQAAAETRLKEVEARKGEAEANKAEHDAEVARIAMERERRKERKELADDEHHHVYAFSGEVSSASVAKCLTQLTTWVRTADGPLHIEIVLNSPGGDIIAGFALIDYLLDLRAKGHQITTVALGMAASMAGVILQAGDTRVMGKHAFLLIHQAQFGAIGSFGEVEDRMKLVKMMQDRILDLFAERSNGKISRASIDRRWQRTDWWISADFAFKYGFIDEVR